jgi:hypothetical protein
MRRQRRARVMASAAFDRAAHRRSAGRASRSCDAAGSTAAQDRPRRLGMDAEADTRLIPAIDSGIVIAGSSHTLDQAQRPKGQSRAPVATAPSSWSAAR